MLSAIMPVFNGAIYIADAINSVLDQTFKNFELIIVNDGSTDDTESILLTYDDPRIKVISLEKNSGRGAARNIAVAACSGKYIAICDADDISLPERFAAQFSYLEANPEISVLSTQVLHFSDGMKPKQLYWFPEMPEAISASYKRGVMGVPHCSCMLRSECFEQHSYDNTFAYNVEDLELFIRLNEEYRMKVLKKPEVLYRNNNLRKLTLKKMSFHQLYHDYTVYVANAKIQQKGYEDFELWSAKHRKSASFQVSCLLTYIKGKARLILNS